MMSVPAINSVLPPSGNQPSKISSSPTASPSVSPIGLSVSPKLSVIPPTQIPTSPSKPPIGVKHSSVPLSLVYENKVVASNAQSSIPKSPDKPKDLSPVKPTSNGVEETTPKVPIQNQTVQPTSAVSSNKPEEAPTQEATTNHSEERVSDAPNDPQTEKEELAQPPLSEPQSKSENNADQNHTQNISKEKNEPEAVETTKEETTAEKKVEKSEETAESSPQATKRKREQKPQEKKNDEPEPEKKPRRIRSQVLPYQSPLPELATFINKSLKDKDMSQKNTEERLIVFYRNEFLAVRNAEGGFYLCQTLQNVYRTSHRIRIRWLSHDKEKSNEQADIYTPDFYDLTDFECILTTVALSKMDKNMYKLQKVELERIENILKRALDVEKGVTEKPSITEEHPDGIDLSLYKDESQLQKSKKSAKRTSSSPIRSPKQAKRDSGEIESKKSSKKAKGKTPSRTLKKVTKTTSEKNKTRKRGGRVDSKSSKGLDQLKISPPNEKARVVAKVLRKVDIVPISTKKKAKSKAAKRFQETTKKQKKKPQMNVKKSAALLKEESSQSHHDRRQGKNKSSSYKNKKN